MRPDAYRSQVHGSLSRLSPRGRKNLGSSPFLVTFYPPGVVAPFRDGNCGRSWGGLVVLGGWFCLGRVEWLRDLIKLVVGFGEITLRRQNHPPVTESPSGYGMTLRVGWRRLVIGDFARIGRVKTLHRLVCLLAPSAFTAAAPLRQSWRTLLSRGREEKPSFRAGRY